MQRFLVMYTAVVCFFVAGCTKSPDIERLVRAHFNQDSKNHPVLLKISDSPVLARNSVFLAANGETFCHTRDPWRGLHNHCPPDTMFASLKKAGFYEPFKKKTIRTGIPERSISVTEYVVSPKIIDSTVQINSGQYAVKIGWFAFDQIVDSRKIERGDESTIRVVFNLKPEIYPWAKKLFANWAKPETVTVVLKQQGEDWIVE